MGWRDRESGSFLLFFSLFIHFSLSVQDKFMSHFSQELLKINTPYLVYR